MTGQADESDSVIRPFTQKQEDLLIELFAQLSLEDRKSVIKVARDLVLAAKSK